MSKIPDETLLQYEKALEKEPNSRIFAALADAYRDNGRIGDAEILVRSGIERHPEYVGGYIVLARILLSTRRVSSAEPVLKKAVSLSPENLLAYQLLGQVYVELKRPQEALKAHKMVLFLNPLAEKSKQAVEKLETLSAVDYDDEVFEMKPLKSVNAQTPKHTRPTPTEEYRAGDLERNLSLIDALIVRNDLSRARQKLKELTALAPENADVKKRWAYFEDDSMDSDGGEELRPVVAREKRILERKREALETALRNIDSHRQIRI